MMSRRKVSPFQMASWIATAVAAFGCAIYAPLPNVGDNEVEHCFSGVRADLSRVRARAAVVLLLLLLLLLLLKRRCALRCSSAHLLSLPLSLVSPSTSSSSSSSSAAAVLLYSARCIPWHCTSRTTAATAFLDAGEIESRIGCTYRNSSYSSRIGWGNFR